MNRSLKKSIARFLPRKLIDLAKGHFGNAFDKPVPARHKLTFQETPDAIRCEVEGGWSFTVPPAYEGHVKYFTTPTGQLEFDTLADVAESGAVVFDIGAHAGITSAILCAGNPRTRVFSFEPSPMLQEQLTEIARFNRFEDRISLERSGIGEKTETIEMLIDPVGGFVQTQRFEHTMWAEPKAIQVRIESIPDAAARLGVVPTVIKLDIEGYEYEAILGATEFLQHHRPTILLEIHVSYLEQRQRSVKTLVETLGRCGYSFFSYSGSELTPKQIYGTPLSNIHVVVRAAGSR